MKVGFLFSLFVILVACKAFAVVDWSWGWILTPMWILLPLWVIKASVAIGLKSTGIR